VLGPSTVTGFSMNTLTPFWMAQPLGDRQGVEVPVPDDDSRPG